MFGSHRWGIEEKSTVQFSRRASLRWRKCTQPVKAKGGSGGNVAGFQWWWRTQVGGEVDYRTSFDSEEDAGSQELPEKPHYLETVSMSEKRIFRYRNP